MIPQAPWIERKFNFDFPAGLYPVFIERLRGTPARVREMIKGISNKKLSKRIDNKWSVKEQIGHLIDMEELHERRFHEFILAKEILSAADMKNQKTEDARHNERKTKRLLAEFTDSRRRFIKQLEKADDDLINRKAIHPRLNLPMRLVDMVYFICEHDDHHLTKMRTIIIT